MDFALTDEQKLLKNVAQEWLSSRCSKALVREMQADPKGYVPALWQEMAANGWLGLVIPEAYGGAGMNFVDLAVLLEEMGRVCLPGPYFSTVVLAGLAISRAGSEAQKQRYLPRIANGSLIATLALTEPSGAWDTDAVHLSALPRGADYVLDGVKLYVPDANIAGLMVTAARTPAGVGLFLVETPCRGLTVTPLRTMAGDKQCEVAFDHVLVLGERLLGELGQGQDVVEDVLRQAAVAKCAESVGGAQQVLEMTVAYAKERIQFGRPIGSFQAIQHHCANMAADVECCRYVTYQAAWRIARGLPAAKEAAIAKAWTSDAYRRVTAVAHAVHGTIGFTMEHDLHLYFRRAKTAQLTLGDAEHHRERVAQEMGL